MNRTEMAALAGETGTMLFRIQNLLDDLEEVNFGLLEEVDFKLDELEARTAYNNLLLHHLGKLLDLIDSIDSVGKLWSDAEFVTIAEARRIVGTVPK